MPDWNQTTPAPNIACPFCTSGDRHLIVPTVWDAPESAVYQCSACKLVFIFPIMSAEEEKSFYEMEFSRYMKQRGGPGENIPEKHFQENRREAARRLRNVEPYLREDMKVLEIGSSTGFMLSALRPHVSSVTGIEPNRLYADYARELEIPTLSDLAEAKSGRYDLILAYYVLEHLRDPVEYLKDLCKLLNPGGRLAVEVPNVDDALVRFYQLESFDRFYWQKAHYYYYSHETLALALERAGFDSPGMIPEHRYDLSNHIHWMLKGEPGGKGKYSHIFNDELDRAYARCLKDHWLCDTVFAVASKKA